MIRVNKRVLINKINNGERYLYIRINNDFYPLFLKQEIIDNLSSIGYLGCEKEKALLLMGDKYYSVLFKIGILCENDSEIQMSNYNFEKETLLLNEKSYKTRTPMLAKYEITYACNYKCKHCYVDGIESEMADIRDIEKTIIQIKENNIPELYITGGEPMLHPYIGEILELCEKIKLPVTIQSNASLISDKIIDRIKESNMIRFAISFHDADEKNFNEFVQTDKAFDRTMKGINLLNEACIPFYLKINVTSENENNIEKTIEFVKTKYSFKIFSQIFPQIADKEDMSKFVNSTNTLKWLYENKYIKFNKNKCSAARLKVWISPDGSVYPCEMIRECAGNIYKEKFQRIWNNHIMKQYLDIEKKLLTEQCKMCSLKEYCNNCPAYLLYRKWSLKCDGFCENAKIVYEVMKNRNKE